MTSNISNLFFTYDKRRKMREKNNRPIRVCGCGVYFQTKIKERKEKKQITST